VIQSVASKHRRIIGGEWPIIPRSGEICDLSWCDNRADAHFNCSHFFCSSCLVCIRKHQKSKKPDSDKLYCPPSSRFTSTFFYPD
jgi:hypothetical protein